MPKIKMSDGAVMLGTDRGRKFGFTPDLFDGYLYKSGGAVYLSVILSKVPGKGNFRRLVERILSLGFSVKVPTPMGKLADILGRNGYRRTTEGDKNYGCDVDVWVLDPPKEKT
jgi:hypothetical protein